MEQQRKNRWVLLGIALLFFGPLLLAIVMQSRWWGYQPAATTNTGNLVQPPAPLHLEPLPVLGPQSGGMAGLQGRWGVVHAYPGRCASDCLALVTGLRQVHRSMGRHRENIVVTLIATAPVEAGLPEKLHALYPEFRLLRDRDGATGRALHAALAAAGTDEAPGGQAFLLDPAGNVILAYAKGFDPNDIKKDLKRLLTWSAQDDTQ